MAELSFFPHEHETLRYAQRTPQFMRPSKVPYAAIFEGVLTEDQCEAIQVELADVETYKFHACNAVSREIHRHPVLDPIENVARYLNRVFFGYDIDEGQHSWMQTYGPGNNYQEHMDGAPGQTRKLTAVAMLSDPEAYAGGELVLSVRPQEKYTPKSRGTIVVFQHWVPHRVTPVTDGERQTINMGFWGPPFK